MSNYKTIEGIRYDGTLLEQADILTHKKENGQIALEGVQHLMKATENGKGITAIEWRTLEYIRKNYPLTQDAADWLYTQLYGITPFEQNINTLLAQDLELPNLKWIIAEDEVNQQFNNSLHQKFTSVLRFALEAFIYEMESPISLREIITREAGIDYEEVAEMNIALKEYLNHGVLYLIPFHYPSLKVKDLFHFELPDDPWSIQDYWLFGLEIPTKTDYHFIAQIKRSKKDRGFSYGYLPKNRPPEKWVKRILKKEFKLKGIEWNISEEELYRQQCLPGNITFVSALREAFRAFLRDDATENGLIQVARKKYPTLHKDNYSWIGEYYTALDGALKPYLKEGKLYLIPESIYGDSSGRPKKLMPPSRGEDPKDNWIFMLRIPLSPKPFFAIVPRSGAVSAYNYTSK